VTSYAESNGLTSEQISRLVDVLVLPNGLDRGSVGRIIGGLFPRGKIDEDVAVRVIGCLGLGQERAPLQIQVEYHLDFLVDSGVIVEMGSDGVSVFHVPYSTSSVVWSHLQLPQLRLPKVHPP
jgi:hypothetical protein